MTSPRQKHRSISLPVFRSEGKPPPGDRPRIEVRTLKIKPNGKVEELSCSPLEYYGTCPNVGDTIVDNMLLKPTFYSVQRRYFVKESPGFSGWALIVREIDPTGPPSELWSEWQAATKFWDEVAEQEEEEDRQSSKVLLKAMLGQDVAKKPPPPKRKRAPSRAKKGE
ncbi:hypothetical protein [Rhizobium redzepovicii]|uniref:hypothetical protein n=1 Tax=Rhizobium redzepovicii TaxID=2867518 RepID=UPI002870C20C|nr:hypothetical protein [Rhizobium redzepovicii]MDR9783873.1 hypothetical protein [Rhizobium redzepovicii]